MIAPFHNELCPPPHNFCTWEMLIEMLRVHRCAFQPSRLASQRQEFSMSTRRNDSHLSCLSVKWHKCVGRRHLHTSPQIFTLFANEYMVSPIRLNVSTATGLTGENNPVTRAESGLLFQEKINSLISLKSPGCLSNTREDAHDSKGISEYIQPVWRPQSSPGSSPPRR